MAVHTFARPNQDNRSSSPARLAKPLHLSLPTTPTRRVRSSSSSPATPRQRAGLATAAAAAPAPISAAKLQEVEDRLLADAIAQHAQCDAALDGALDDIAVLSAELRRSRRRPLLLRSATNLNRVEDLLLEAVVRSHPNRENALDRLLADVSADDRAAAEEDERARFDMQIDNDFDGMG